MQYVKRDQIVFYFEHGLAQSIPMRTCMYATCFRFVLKECQIVFQARLHDPRTRDVDGPRSFLTYKLQGQSPEG